jgi:hypothetical protein
MEKKNLMQNGNTPATALKTYRIECEIDIEGVTSPEEAARQAWDGRPGYGGPAGEQVGGLNG